MILWQPMAGRPLFVKTEENYKRLSEVANLFAKAVRSPWDFLAVEDSDEEASSAESIHFAQMMEKMNSTLNSLMEQGTVSKRPNEGEICAVLQREDNKWHRVRIDTWLEKNKGQYACCYLIDKGCEVTAPVQRLMKVPPEYAALPSQVLHCRLWGIQPLSLKVEESDTGLTVENRPCKKWDSSASQYMIETFDTCRKHKINVITIDSDSKLYVRLLLNTKHGTVCFNDILVKEQYAMPTKESDKAYMHTDQGSTKLIGTMNGLENVGSDGAVADYEDMPCLMSEAYKTPHFDRNANQHLFQEEMEKEIHQDEICPPLMCEADLKVVQRSDESCSPSARSMDGNTPYYDDDCPSLINELSPSVANFFKKCISSREKFPPLSPQSSTAQEARTFAHELDKSLSSPPPLLSTTEEQMSSPLPKKSFSMSSPSPSSSTQSTPSKHLLQSSPQIPLVHKFFQGRGRALLASCADRKPGHPVKASPINMPDQVSPKEASPVKESIPANTLPNGYCTDNTKSFDSDIKSMSISSPVPSSLPLNKSRPAEVEKGTLQAGKTRSVSMSNAKSQLSDGGNSATSSSAGTRARFRKSGDVLLEKTERKSTELRKGTKPIKPDSDKIQMLLKTSAPDIRDSAVRQARGQALGRQILESLRQNSGHAEPYPIITRPDQPVPRPLFGVLVHGKSPPALTCDVADVPFEEKVKQILEKDEIQTARSIQGFVWPAALACRHIIGVCPPEKGKTTAYVPAIVSLLTDKIAYIELPKGKGPLALVLAPTWKKARDVFEMVQNFTADQDMEMSRIRPIVLYAGGTEDKESTETSLVSGCEILISTPASVLRILEQELTSFQRLCHVVMDDADILATRFADQVDEVMQQFSHVLRNRRHQVVPCQIMMFASRWTEKLDEFRQCYLREPVVVISSRVEASVYGSIKQVVTMSKLEQGLSTFCSLLDTMVLTDKRVAAFTSDVEEAVEMWKGAKSRGVYCLLIHHELPCEAVTEAREQWLHSSYTKQLIVMVCTDQCYQDLAITNATDVIHYGLPDSKTKFGNRLACMFDYFRDRTTNEEYQPEKEAEGVSHVILTDRCAPRAQQLNEILQRCPSQHPPQLLEFLRGYRLGVENDERKMLCPLLKAFGTCIAHNNQENCKNRHVVIPKHDLKTGETDGSSLPPSGQVTIKILRVVTAGRFYCHLVGHRALDSTATQDLRLTYFKLAMDLASFFCKRTNQMPYLPSEDPFNDGLCAFKDEDGVFSRAKVLETKEGTRSAPMRQCKVWLVDLGCYKYGTVDQLLALPRRMAEVPYQAVEVYLCCVKPMDDDREWTDQGNIHVHNLVEGKELVGRIMLSAGLTLWLMPLVHQVKLKEVGVTSDISLRQELLQKKFAVTNPDHMKMLYEIYRGKVKIPERLMSQYYEFCLEIELTQEMLSTDQDDFVKVNIAAVISPALLYLHREGAADKLEKLEMDIQAALKEFDAAADRGEKIDTGMTLECGSVCLALSSDDRWYRAKLVSDCLDGQWEVFFLDYGDREHLPQDCLRALPRCLGELPCQAIECELAYVTPIGEEWSGDTVDILCDLSYFASEDKKKLLFAKVLASKESHFSMGKKLVVDLYETQRDEIRFSHELVKRHRAAVVSIDERDPPLLQPILGKPALKNQMFFNPLDKVKFLSANLYWTEDPAESMQQAEELKSFLSLRMKGWDKAIDERGVLPSVVSVIGYIPNVKAHGVMLRCLAKCCLDSLRLCDVAIEHGLLERLSCCLEQKTHADVQTQAAEAVAYLIANDSFKEECLEISTLTLTLNDVLSSHTPESPVTLEVLKNLCYAASQLVYAAQESLPCVCSMDEIIQALVEATEDCDREPWLELLAAMASKQCTHSHLMRQNSMNIILGLLATCLCAKCVYYCSMVCLSLVEVNRKHKKVLLENKLLITINRLLEDGLTSPAQEVCEKLKSAMTLQMPAPEVLSGIAARNNDSMDKVRCPEVLWSQNCFRVVLKVKVRNAHCDDFHLTPERISCRVQSDTTTFELDWELYDMIIPERSKIDIQPTKTVISLKKVTKGQWNRLRKEKQKVLFLKPDLDHLYNSDSDVEELEEDDNLTKLTQKKKVIWRDGSEHVKLTPMFQSSDDSSSEDPALYSSGGEDEPKISTDFLLQD